MPFLQLTETGGGQQWPANWLNMKAGQKPTVADLWPTVNGLPNSCSAVHRQPRLGGRGGGIQDIRKCMGICNDSEKS